jgi:hypothetical protein
MGERRDLFNVAHLKTWESRAGGVGRLQQGLDPKGGHPPCQSNSLLTLKDQTFAKRY